MKRTPEQAQQTRESLLRAALAVFDQRGTAHATLAEIAAEAGVTRGALYWHFKSREDLLDALFQHLLATSLQRLDEDIRSGAPDMLSRLKAMMLGHFERVEHDAMHRKFFRVLHLKCELTGGNTAIAAVKLGYLRTLDEMVQAALTLCIRNGSLPAALDVEAASLFLHSMLFGLLHHWLLLPERFALLPQAERTIDAAIDALRTSAALQRSTDAP